MKLISYTGQDGMEEDILNTLVVNYPWLTIVHVYEYIRDKVEEVDHSKMHYLPMETCPNPECEDWGVCVYRDDPKGQAQFYCYFCHSHYHIRYSVRDKTAKERTPNYKPHKPDLSDLDDRIF